MWKRGWPGRSLWSPTQVSIRMVWWRVLSTQLWMRGDDAVGGEVVVGRRSQGRCASISRGVPVGQQYIGWKPCPRLSSTPASRSRRCSRFPALYARPNLRRSRAMKVDGGCHCGHIRYEAEVDPQKVVICHCTDCQTLSGSAFRTVVPTERRHLQAAVGRAQGLRQDRRERQQAGADVLPGLRHADLLGPGGRRAKVVGLRVGTIRQREQLIPQRPVLVPLRTGMARRSPEDRQAGEAAGVRPQGRLRPLIFSAVDPPEVERSRRCRADARRRCPRAAGDLL